MASKPHHHHALTKASATHLRKAGHITPEQHQKIVKSAERGMKAAKNQRAMAMPPPAMGPQLASGMGGGMDDEMD